MRESAAYPNGGVLVTAAFFSLYAAIYIVSNMRERRHRSRTLRCETEKLSAYSRRSENRSARQCFLYSQRILIPAVSLNRHFYFEKMSLTHMDGSCFSDFFPLSAPCSLTDDCMFFNLFILGSTVEGICRIKQIRVSFSL